jgi:dephospho-CoA kinase
MLKIGITGGIGSGKTTVAKLFSALGIPVYYADDRGKAVASEDPEVVKKIKEAFGEEAYVDGKLDHKRMASIVFSDKERLQTLNSIVHPAAQRDWEKWSSEQTAPYVIREVAILFEIGAEKDLDFVIGVEAPEEVRIERVMKRNSITREEVIARIRNQMPQAEKMARCNFVIDNGGEKELEPQVLEIDTKLMNS